MSDDLRHLRVSVRPHGAVAWYVSDEHQETIVDAVAAALRRRQDLLAGPIYEFSVRDVDRERER